MFKLLDPEVSLSEKYAERNPGQMDFGSPTTLQASANMVASWHRHLLNKNSPEINGAYKAGIAPKQTQIKNYYFTSHIPIFFSIGFARLVRIFTNLQLGNKLLEKYQRGLCPFNT